MDAVDELKTGSGSIDLKAFADHKGIGLQSEYRHKLSRAASIYGGAWAKYQTNINRMDYGAAVGLRVRW